jgi:hypothetical protein
MTDIIDWGFDLTSFGSAQKFQDLLKRHGLSAHRLVVEHYDGGAYSGRHVWYAPREGLEMVTKNNPLTGMYGDGTENRKPEKGYASYIGITGEKSKVLALVKDIKKTTKDIKDESPNERQFI